MPLTPASMAILGNVYVGETLDGRTNIESGDWRSGISDALVNLFHLCDREKVDVDDVLANAKMHWEQER